jgi:hypothetical protein
MADVMLHGFGTGAGNNAGAIVDYKDSEIVITFGDYQGDSPQDKLLVHPSGCPQWTVENMTYYTLGKKVYDYFLGKEEKETENG